MIIFPPSLQSLESNMTVDTLLDNELTCIGSPAAAAAAAASTAA